MLDRNDAGDRAKAVPGYALPAIVVAAILTGIFAIDRQSYWMDELGTWQYAGVTGIGAWFRGFLAIGNSDGQLPLYHFLIFLWSRVAGLSEEGLRSLNALFLVGSVVAVAVNRALPGALRLRWLALLIANCFVWAYLNEARPYVMLLAGSLCLTLALAEAYARRAAPGRVAMGGVVTLFFTGALLSFGASPISAPFIAAMAIGILGAAGTTAWPGIARIGRLRLLWCAICVLAAVIIAALVLYSLSKGATPELRNSTSIATTLFGVLEVIGGGGYVPGRDTLRTLGVHALQPWQWAALGVLALAWAAATLSALLGRQRGLAAILIAIIAFSMLCAVIAGYAIGFRVVGRHFAFAVPPLALLMAIGCASAGRHVRGATLAALALLLGSTALFRLDGEHLKDDTGGIAAIVKDAQAHDRRTWWVGGYIVPLYFQLPTRDFRDDGAPRMAAWKAGEGEDWKASLDRLPVPDTLIVERPEVNDPEGMFARYAQRSGLTRKRELRGYVAYQRPR
ncbi:MAG: hypothetical protein ABW184_10885 [Sphingobium sp.]